MESSHLIVADVMSNPIARYSIAFSFELQETYAMSARASGDNRKFDFPDTTAFTLHVTEWTELDLSRARERTARTFDNLNTTRYRFNSKSCPLHKGLLGTYVLCTA